MQYLQARLDSFTVFQGGTGNYAINTVTESKNKIHLGKEIKELNEIRETESTFEFGSCVKLTEMEKYFKNYVSNTNDSIPSKRLANAFLVALSNLASTQIRNVASVGGSIMWKHPSSDLMSLYMVLGCKIRLQEHDGETTDVFIDDSFHSQKSEQILNNKAVITSLILPKLSKSQYIRFFKKSKRKEFALSIFNMAILLTHDITASNKTPMFFNVKIVVGGTENPGQFKGSNYHKYAPNTMVEIEGNQNLMRTALVSAITKDLPITSEYKKLGTYRQGLAISYIEKFLSTFNNSLEGNYNRDGFMQRSSTQSYQKVTPEQPDYDEVERPIPHHCSAEQGKIIS